MPDTPNERRNCWTCRWDESDGSCGVQAGSLVAVDSWMNSARQSGEWQTAECSLHNMPPRTTPTPCPGWTPKETSDD